MFRLAVKRVIDGDTIVADVELPLGITLRDQRIRIASWNAPERGTPEGGEATELLREIVEANRWQLWIRIAPRERDQYGRVLGELYLDSLGVQPLSSALIKRWLDGQASSS